MKEKIKEKEEYTAEDMVNNKVSWVIKINAPAKEFLRFDGFCRKNFNNERWVGLKYLMDMMDTYNDFVSLYRMIQDLDARVKAIEMKDIPQDSGKKIKTFGKD